MPIEDTPDLELVEIPTDADEYGIRERQEFARLTKGGEIGTGLLKLQTLGLHVTASVAGLGEAEVDCLDRKGESINTADILHALAYIVGRRANPELTLEEALDLDYRMLEADDDPKDESD